MKALVVDDNPYNRQIFQIALENIGYVVATEENGFNALVALDTDDFKLLILDMEMPSLGGSDVLKAISSSERWKQLLIVVVTANHHMVTGDVEARADYIMHKPVDIAQFKTLIQRLQ
jgi:CheY-like chemotaxis protein